MKPVTLTTASPGPATRQQMVGPCSVFADGAFGGGTLAVQVSRTSTSDLITLASFTTDGVTNVNIIGPYFITATLSGSTAGTVVVGSSPIE